MQKSETDKDIVELWQSFRQGNADAYGRLMRLFYDDLYHYGSRFSKDVELVKDCIQDLFLVIWNNRETIQDTSFVKYYLLKSLRRIIARAMDKNKWFSRSTEPDFDASFGTALSPENIRVQDEMLLEQSNQLRLLLSKLSQRQQEVIYLRFYLDADIPEIADIIGINRQSVYNLLYDALKKLKGNSRDHFDIKPLIMWVVGYGLLK